jgi:D-alanine-D-alanine ligase
MAGSKTAILHLAGSAVDEDLAELSLLYARGCLDAIDDPQRYQTLLAYISPGGLWQFPANFSRSALAAAPQLSVTEALERLTALNIDVAVPQMFCQPGMTTYRSLLSDHGIPYLGNPPEVMAIAADKPRARSMVAAAGVSIPEGEVIRPGARSRLSVPVVVKPASADNSDGVSLVRHPGEYGAAIDLASSYSDAVLVESYVELGREVRCGILVRDGELICLPLEEYAVDPTTKPIRDRSDKLARSDNGDLYLVAKDPSRAWIVDADDPVNESVFEAAKRCHVVLGCRHYSLFDFRIDPNGKPWFLEAGPYCSFAPTSVIAVMAAAIGIGVRELFDVVLGESQKERNQPCVLPR